MGIEVVVKKSDKKDKNMMLSKMVRKLFHSVLLATLILLNIKTKKENKDT